MRTRADVAPADQPDDPGHTPYERVQMVSPTLPDNPPVSVTWFAFTVIWQPRGWVLYTPPDDPDPADPDPDDPGDSGGDDTPPDDPAPTDPDQPDAPADPQEQ